MGIYRTIYYILGWEYVGQTELREAEQITNTHQMKTLLCSELKKNQVHLKKHSADSSVPAPIIQGILIAEGPVTSATRTVVQYHPPLQRFTKTWKQALTIQRAKLLPKRSAVHV